MEKIQCIICQDLKYSLLFQKKSGDGFLFDIQRCKSCGLEFVSPRPDVEEIAHYYDKQYFTQRTDRGYNNYFSDEIRTEIIRVLGLNLKDLGFFDYEETCDDQKNYLDIGCAAGYSVEFLKKRGWDSSGIDVSHDCVENAQSRDLDVIQGDYLQWKNPVSCDVISMWATIEHLHCPHLFLEKIHSELKSGAMLYISTCRSGGINFKQFKGSQWRYYNVPEHLFYFSKKNIKKLLAKHGFVLDKYITYGSGFGTGGSIVRKAADYMARHWNMGDMMLIGAKKK
jgi:2-polyprenyl-3-methyl-5-hydroxy-6-metoxy-1,4-benzoquinol methylase